MATLLEGCLWFSPYLSCVLEEIRARSSQEALGEERTKGMCMLCGQRHGVCAQQLVCPTRHRGGSKDGRRERCTVRPIRPEEGMCQRQMLYYTAGTVTRHYSERPLG